MTTEQMNNFIETFQLKDFPESTYFACGMNHLYADQKDLAMVVFICEAKNDSYVGCMFCYVYFQHECNNFHLEVSWALEGVIRGHTVYMMLLITIYNLAKPAQACA